MRGRTGWVVSLVLITSLVACGDDDLPPPPPPADTSVVQRDSGTGDASLDGSSMMDTGVIVDHPRCPALDHEAVESLGLLETSSRVRLAASDRHPDHFYVAFNDAVHIAVLSRARADSAIVATLDPDVLIADLRGLAVGPDGVYLAYPDPDDEAVAVLARFDEPPDIKETIDVSVEVARHRFPFEDRGFTSMFYDWPTDRVWLVGSRAYFANFGSGLLGTIGIVFFARGAIDPSIALTTDITYSKRGDALVTSTGLFYRGRPEESLRDTPADRAPNAGGVAFARDSSGVYRVQASPFGPSGVTFTPCRMD